MLTRASACWGTTEVGPAVGVAGVGGVEQLEERHPGLAVVGEVEAPPARGQALGEVDVGAAEGRVEAAGDVQQAVADLLGLHPRGGKCQ